MLSNEFPAHLQKALRELRRNFESQTDVARREYVRKCLKAHEFFRGNQYLWWDVRAGEYRAPTQTGGLMAGNTPSQMQSLYTINIYQGFAMSMIAILTANHPTKRFFPLKAGDPNDQAASEKFNSFLKIYEKQTDEFEKLLEEVYLLWCDGTFGSYIHTVADGSRFGWLEEPIYEDVPTTVGYDTYKCVVCGDVQPQIGTGMCPSCGAPYSDGSVIPAPVVMQKKQTGTNYIPKTRVQVDTVGGLELKLPPMAKNMGEYPYLIRARELPKAMVRSAYPEISDKINGAPSGGLDGSIEKRARLQTAQGSTVENRAVYANTSQDVTFRETWFRPWAFFEIDDENLRQELLNTFPEGCYYAEANDTFCEVRPEKMDDKWRICHAMPGRGQLREPIGGSLIQIQEIYNDISNMVRDVIEYTLPSTFVDNEVLDVKRWARSNVMAGAAYNVRARPGRAVQDAFWQTQPGQLPQYTGQMLEEMRSEIPQFTAGLFPASYGAGTPGNGTASGIAVERDAAMGRVGIFWRVLKKHHAEIAPLIVKEFSQTGLEPVSLTEETEGGSLVSISVSPDDLKQGEVQTYAETVEDYPTSWPQRQGLLMSLMANPLFQGAVAKLANLKDVKQILGMELEMPGEQAYNDEWKIIEQLITQQPVPGPPDPMTGQPGPPQSSIMPGPLDDNQAMLEACMDFDQSDRGQQLRTANPMGYQNFILHALARKAALAPPMPPPPAGPNGPPAPGEPAPAGPPPMVQ